MAQASRNEKRKRRLRRNVSLVTRQASQLQVQLMQTQFMLFQVLSQIGGEVTLTKETTQNVVQNIRRLGWETKAAENGITLRLVEAPTVAITKVEDTPEEAAAEEAAAHEREFGSPDTESSAQGAD